MIRKLAFHEISQKLPFPKSIACDSALFIVVFILIFSVCKIIKALLDRRLHFIAVLGVFRDT